MALIGIYFLSLVIIAERRAEVRGRVTEYAMFFSFLVSKMEANYEILEAVEHYGHPREISARAQAPLGYLDSGHRRKAPHEVRRSRLCPSCKHTLSETSRHGGQQRSEVVLTGGRIFLVERRQHRRPLFL